MAWVYSSSLNLARIPVSPVTRSVNSDVKVQIMGVAAKTTEDLPIQVRGKVIQKEQESKNLTSVSRRNMAMQLAIASLAAITTILPDPAEARVIKPETKRKIFEKLKMLREKAGLSNPNTENVEKTSPPTEEKEKADLSTSPLVEEKEKALTPPPISPFSTPTSDSIVEASVS